MQIKAHARHGETHEAVYRSSDTKDNMTIIISGSIVTALVQWVFHRCDWRLEDRVFFGLPFGILQLFLVDRVFPTVVNCHHDLPDQQQDNPNDDDAYDHPDDDQDHTGRIRTLFPDLEIH